MSSYYLIGYQPQREDFRLIQGHPPFHKIEVKVLRPGLQVRFRNGFMGTPDATASSHSKSGREELRNALFRRSRPTAFPFI